MKFLIAIMLTALTTNSFAKSTAEIFTGSSNANVNMVQTGHEEYETRFNIDLGYDHAFSNGLQLGAEVTGNFGSDFNIFSLLVGPAYNFNSEDLENSFYIGAKGGFITATFEGTSATDAIISAEISKRFKLADGISYVPGVNAAKVLGPNSNDPTIVFNLFKFSVLF